MELHNVKERGCDMFTMRNCDVDGQYDSSLLWNLRLCNDTLVVLVDAFGI